MAVSTCAKCAGHSFELAPFTPLGTSHKLAMVQCSELRNYGNYGDSALNRPFGAACRAVSFIHASNLHRRALPEMRVKPNFSSRIKLICPVQPYSKKYSDFQKSQITL